MGQGIVDDMADAFNVNPPAGDVCCHKHPYFPRLETLQYTDTLSLRNLTGDSIRQFTVSRRSEHSREEVLAGMVMFHCNPRVTLAFYISHDDQHQALRPVNLLYRGVIEWARDLGYHYLDLGTYTLEMEVNYGLCRFKESFSARGFFRNTFIGRA